jgi:hypothetical protein
LGGKGLDEARAIIDILSPFPVARESGSRWWALILKACSEEKINLEKENIVLTKDGWNSILQTSLLPHLENPKIITKEELYSEATFPVFHQGLLSLEDQIYELYSAIKVAVLPSDEDLASTVERIAKKLHNKMDTVDWNGYLHDVSELFPNNVEKLKGVHTAIHEAKMGVKLGDTFGLI